MAAGSQLQGGGQGARGQRAAGLGENGVAAGADAPSVQNLLANYTHTALPLDDLRSPDWTPGEVNMVVSDLSGPVALYSGPIRAAGGDRKCWFELVGRTSRSDAGIHDEET